MPSLGPPQAPDSSSTVSAHATHIIGCAGSLVVSGDFKPVSALKNQRQANALHVTVYLLIHGHTSLLQETLNPLCCRGLDANMQRVEFMSLNHRGQVMPMVAPAIK